MKASNDFLIALANKLQEISNNTSDQNTKEELESFVEIILASIN